MPRPSTMIVSPPSMRGIRSLLQGGRVLRGVLSSSSWSSAVQAGAMAPLNAFLPLFGVGFLAALHGPGRSLSLSCLALMLCDVFFFSGAVGPVSNAPPRGHRGLMRVAV